jgi:hypothetical protein
MTKDRSEKKSTHKGFVGGTALYQQRAAQALPILVRQAKALQPVFYRALADELGMPFALNLNKVLGAVGHELVRLAAKWRVKIPPIQCLVVNQHTGIPSHGIGWFVPDREAFQKGTPQQKRQIVDAMLADVFTFRRWSDVLAEFGLKAAKARPKSSPPLPPPMEGGFGGGESEDHRLLKEYVAAHPDLLGLPANLKRGETEFGLPSADCIDVLFMNGLAWIGAEVKSVLSSEDDIVRGMFQCIKYRALIEAVQKYEEVAVNARVVLVLGKPLPMNLIWARNLFGIEIKEDVQLPAPFKARMVSSAK